jgi:hypothetical protein
LVLLLLLLTAELGRTRERSAESGVLLIIHRV